MVHMLIIQKLYRCAFSFEFPLNPFNIYSSIVLLLALLLVIVIWYKSNAGNETQFEESDEKYLFLKLLASLASLVIAAWLITKGAFNILETMGIGELFVGFTVLAIGTSLPEIAAALALAAKGILVMSVI